VAETFKNANVNTEEEITQSTDEKEESRSLESSHTVENLELGKIKIEFYKALKEFEGTDPNTRYQVPKQKCSRRLATIIAAVNREILPEYLKHNVTNFLELHDTIYGAAVATARLSGARIDRKQLNHIQNKTKTPPWERRLKTQIDDLRKGIGRMQQAQNGSTSNRLQKHIRRIRKKVHVHDKRDPNNAHNTEILDTLKQKISVKSQRLRRYKEANERKQQNRFFYHQRKSLLP
jgi:hypothetical protein